ncbi:MAG: hypothetical protein GYB32_02255 [Algicola sp.]|nr:hypothetical protein [Algicola sp.]
MKQTFLVVVIALITFGCKNDKATTDATVEEQTSISEDGKTAKQSDGFIAIQGNFLYVEKDNAAVLQTPTQMYGVIVDDMMKELNKQVEVYKTEPYQMVPVTIRARIFKKEGATNEWENKVEIKEILKVSEPTKEDSDIVKLGS